jgi:hypothetical protein
LIETPNPDALGSDAAGASDSLDIPLDEARQALTLQPEKGELQQTLAERSDGFGGMVVTYDPYQINVLAEPGRGADLREAVLAAAPNDLVRFVVVKETPYTEDALTRARAEFEQRAGGLLVSSDVDLKNGNVILYARTADSVASLRQLVTDSGVYPVDHVEVAVGGATPASSYGGRKIVALQNGSSDACTSGFSVSQTSGGNSDGITDAGHCFNNLAFEFNPDVNLSYQDGQEGGNLDVQWFTTPNVVDDNLVKDQQGTRSITSRTARGDMSPGDIVCHYGYNGGWGCGEINSVNFDIGAGFNATFICVRDDTIELGDSGGPWFAANSAYGTTYGYNGANPLFIAENYMNLLNIQVKTS